MKYPPVVSLVSLIVLAILTAGLPAVAEDLKSPDGKVVVEFKLTESGGPRYAVSYQGKPVLLDSALGLVLKDAAPLVDGFKIEKISHSSHDETWKPVYGERSQIRDHYNEMTVELVDSQKTPRKLVLTFLGAYDEGIAVCYSLPAQKALPKCVITEEKTQFRFAADHAAWPVYSAQGVYQETTLSKVKPHCERPLVVKIADGPTVAIGEARLVDFARMRLMPAKDSPHTLQSHLAGEVQVAAPLRSPWRFVMIGDTPGQLIERNYLLLNLNDPCAIEDPSWIKPGKVIRDVTLTTAGGKACVDFAVSRGLQYVEFDAGWYGPENKEESDATTITRDGNKAGVQGKLDLPEVIRYADARGIGIIVYVNRRHLERQLDEILPLYQKWGIKGVKYGFVQVGSQQWTAWLHDAIRKAAKHKLMVDIHDEYRPTGYSRTYPNLMTSEGIRGNECMPEPVNTLILPFTRGLCGAGDYTVCWYSGRIKTTRAFQLATPVVIYSPWHFLYWYDRPQQYQGEPELDYFKHIPTAWDETRVLSGEIGRHITVARRSGDAWFVASLNAVEQRRIVIPLSFLEAGRKYTAEIHADADTKGVDRKKVSIRRVSVDAGTTLSFEVPAGGGLAIRVVPE